MTPAKLRESESDFQTAVIQYARALGWLVYHTFDSRKSSEGFPDLVLVRGTRVVFAELKAQHGSVSYDQRVWLQSLSATQRVEVYEWRPQDWEKVAEVLTRRQAPREEGSAV